MNGTVALNSMWNEPSIMLPAPRVMIDYSCSDMASLRGIDNELAAPIAEMTETVHVSNIRLIECGLTQSSLVLGTENHIQPRLE